MEPMDLTRVQTHSFMHGVCMCKPAGPKRKRKSKSRRRRKKRATETEQSRSNDRAEEFEHRFLINYMHECRMLAGAASLKLLLARYWLGYPQKRWSRRRIWPSHYGCPPGRIWHRGPSLSLDVNTWKILDHAYWWLRLTLLGMLSLWAMCSATSRHHMVVFALDLHGWY